MRFAWLALLALVLATCGGEDQRAVLDPTSVPGGPSSDSGGSDDGDCRVIDGAAGDRLTLTGIDGPFDDVRQGAVFEISGGYRLAEDDVDVYVIGTICNTVCEETKATPPLAPGSGTYHSEFRVVSVPHPADARNCLAVTMVALDNRTLVSCEYHF